MSAVPVHNPSELPKTVALGPYVLTVGQGARSGFARRNRNWDVDFNRQTLTLANHIAGAALTQAFLMAVVGVIHYTHGLDDTSTEESFTHSFASGVLEFAHRNPQAWTWLNSQFDAMTQGRARYLSALRPGASVRRRVLPRRVLIGTRVVVLTHLSAKKADRERVWGYYDYTEINAPAVRLHEELTGRHLAVIFLHELTHAFHHQAKLRKRETYRRFIRTQVGSLLHFVKHNFTAWQWLLVQLQSDS